MSSSTAVASGNTARRVRVEVRVPVGAAPPAASVLPSVWVPVARAARVPLEAGVSRGCFVTNPVQPPDVTSEERGVGDLQLRTSAGAALIQTLGPSAGHVAARSSEALIYTPRGLPAGDDLGPRGKRSGKAGGGGDTNIHIENLNLDNVRDAHQFVRELDRLIDSKLRTTGVSMGRG